MASFVVRHLLLLLWTLSCPQLVQRECAKWCPYTISIDSLSFSWGSLVLWGIYCPKGSAFLIPEIDSRELWREEEASVLVRGDNDCQRGGGKEEKQKDDEFP